MLVSFGQAENTLVIPLGYGQGFDEDDELKRGPTNAIPRRPRRREPRLQRLSAAHRRHRLFRHRCEGRLDRQALLGRPHAGAQRDVWPRPGPRDFHLEDDEKGGFDAQLANVTKQGNDSHAPPNISLYKPEGPPPGIPARMARPSVAQRPAPPVGHVDRPFLLHGLQRLPGRLPGGEQHSDRRQETGRQRPRNALDPHGPLFRHAEGQHLRRGQSGARSAAGRLRAVRVRALRNGLPGQRHRPHRGRPQRDGLQPLHRHPLLREQLPLQGAPLQLLRLQQAQPAHRPQPLQRSARREAGRRGRTTFRRTRTSPSACAA